jgi:hypothetical protein
MDFVYVIVVLVTIILLIGLFLLCKRAHKHNNQKYICVLRTHVLHPKVFERYMKLQNDLGAENVFMLVDVTRDETLKQLESLGERHVKWSARKHIMDPHIITITEDDCKRLNSLHKNSMENAEAHFVACKVALEPQHYHYLWMIEYDIHCHGNWTHFMNGMKRIRADLLCKGFDGDSAEDVMTPYNNPKWYWWLALTGSMTKTKLEDRRGCFFPIVRCSKLFLEVLENNLNINSGFCEVYFPTLCYINNLVLEAMPLSSFGIFRFKPVLPENELDAIPINDKLYHPLK